MSNSKKIMVACLGKSDPYTLKNGTCHTGPTLTLILNYLPDHIILFISKDIKDENRFDILQRTIQDLYNAKRLAPIKFEVIDIETEKETYNYQEVLRLACNELRSRLAKFQKSDRYIFSKTSGTPQYKTALEIFPHLYMEGYSFEVATKEHNPPAKGIFLEPGKFYTRAILEDIADDELNIKKSIANMIHSNEDDLNIQKVFADLGIFRELIQAYEYNAAKTILVRLFPFVKSSRDAEVDNNWLNNIYSPIDIRKIYKTLNFAMRLLSFDLPQKNSHEKVFEYIPCIKQLFLSDEEMYYSKTNIAYCNFEIFKRKSLNKDMILSFGIFLERIRKNSLKKVIVEQGLFDLLKNESIKEENIVTTSYKFYDYLHMDASAKSSYIKLKDLRNQAAHDFSTINDDDASRIIELEKVVFSIAEHDFNVNINVYSEINGYILNTMFSLNSYCEKSS